MFIHDNFLLQSDAATELYYNYAVAQPIIDFHSHLSPKVIAQNYEPRSITELWLAGDHYKWRAMRAAGVAEHYITGEATDYEKFEKWAQTLPHTMRNPLYHWTQLELKRYFGIDKLLNGESAREIYQECNRQINQGGFGALDLLKKMNVEALCTTDDPLDTLEYHGTHDGIKVLPTWRPDRFLTRSVDSDFDAYLSLLKERQKHFIAKGCRVADHGLSTLSFGDDYAENMLVELAKMNSEAGWVQQLHIGAIRNNNSLLFRELGTDIGCDSIHDTPLAEPLNKFLNSLNSEGKLAKTIIYNLNPKDTEVIMTALYNFNDGSSFGKMQYGSAWWFLDNQNGMKKQINALSDFGLLSAFVGMVTDSRSFLSFTRHEYFRRILCNILGKDIEKGLLPHSEIGFIGEMVARISYTNAKNYFGL